MITSKTEDGSLAPNLFQTSAQTVFEAAGAPDGTSEQAPARLVLLDFFGFVMYDLTRNASEHEFEVGFSEFGVVSLRVGIVFMLFEKKVFIPPQRTPRLDKFKMNGWMLQTGRAGDRLSNRLPEDCSDQRSGPGSFVHFSFPMCFSPFLSAVVWVGYSFSPNPKQKHISPSTTRLTRPLTHTRTQHVRQRAGHSSHEDVVLPSIPPPSHTRCWVLRWSSWRTP